MSQAVIERQIRPIYDAVDSGSNKSALQQCNKVLKKYPSLVIVKALKALAIVRMNKIEESLPICDEVLASKPTDLDTLNVMMLVLRALGRHNDLVTMFDDAFKAQPGNEELGVQDFFANVRTGNWKAAQQIAQRLNKSFGAGAADRYLYWSVLSAMLQSNDCTTPTQMRPVLQKLAHRLLADVELPPHASADRLHVHLSVLKTLGLADDAAKLLDTEEGKAISKTSLVVDELRRELVKIRSDFEAEGTRARGKLVDEKDRNWLEFLALIEATFVTPDATKIREARDVLRQLAESDGTKEQKFAKQLESYEHSVDNVNALLRSINVYKLQRYILSSEQVTSELEKVRARDYLDAYTKALPLGKALADTELQPADDLVLLAAQTFVNLWKIENDENWLYMAVSVLEYAAQRSKNSYLIRLHLVRLHRLLSSPSLALEHYRAMRIKQIQTDTLSHFLLARASTYSLAAAGDLTLTQECVEASHIYVSNSQDTSEFIVRAFAQEKYSQIPDLIEFEERLECSLQRDLVKMEHVRMRLAHEGLSSDLVDMELIELKFIFDRTHHDNRDFEVLPSLQPRGQPTFNEQTLMINSPGLGWLRTFLRIYIRVFLLATDIDDTVEEKLLIGDRPKVADTPENKIPLRERIHERKEDELKELSKDELHLFNYVSELCDWLAPYHDHARPPPEVVLAEANKLAEQLRSGKNTVKPQMNGAASPSLNGHKKNVEDAPPVKEAPELIINFFDEMAARFKEVNKGKSLPWEKLHVATITQEAALMLALVSMRFKQPGVVKQNKFGALTTNLRTLRQKAASVLKDMSNELSKIGAASSTADQRRVFVTACKPIQEFSEFENDTVLDVAKRVGDAQKRVIEGIAKGISKISSTQMQ
ncbi:actin cytoskeleton organization [Pyrrhoderma noxium]|uniref:Actin cytoskeleton organization n=1 Tax=Pyrrhoderma noxium TaxID=2282107 RepID=A0A286UX08_9AGAM|nr:actin cytoskeleton organization [Pyrrhoderma noxium]